MRRWRDSAARTGAGALFAFGFCGDALAQGSTHALRFHPASASGQDRVLIPIDDDAPGADASTPADVGAADFTLEFWIRGTLAANATAGGGGDREYFVQNWKDGNVVFDREVGGVHGAEFGIAVAGGNVRFGTGRGAAAPFDPEHTLEGSENVLNGAWRHVACVRDAASGVKRIFVDGMLDFESAAVSFADLSYPNDGGLQGGGAVHLVLGAAASGGAPEFAGELDEVRIWSAALTPSQILSRYDRVLPGIPAALSAWFRFEEGAGTIAADTGPSPMPPATVVAGVTGNAEWTDYFIDPAVCAPISPGLLPPGFQRSVLTESLTQPVALEFLPDGRLLIAERGGAIRLFENGALTPTPVLTLAVDTALGERGVLGLARDPQFASNGYFYVFHTSLEPRDRVSRFKLVGSTASPASEFVVWQAPTLASNFHHAGGLAFDATGMLLIAVGDQLDSANAQDLGKPFGKLLRVAPDGSIPADNPFLGVSSAAPEVFAAGLRNPFRLSVDTDGTIYVGDVGGNTTLSQEEANVVAAGANLGWPSQEGAACYFGDCAQYSLPIWSYAHSDPDFFLLAPQGSITMGPRYRAGKFPAPYQGNLFVADYANRSLRRLIFDEHGAVVADPIFLWPGLGRTIVDLEVGPDGALWYLAYGVHYGGIPDTPGLLRIDWIGGANAPPLAVASAAPANGAAPLAVQFSSAGSLDPDASPQPLQYSWSFGDGGFSTQSNPQHVYSQNGKYVAQLTVSDGAATTGAASLSIEVGAKPAPTITAPLAGARYVAGQSIVFAGAATDLEDGALAPGSLAFEILLVHAGHIHPFAGPTSGVASGSFTVPDSGHSPASTHFLVRLTATDSDGLAATSEVEIFPDTSTLALATLPSGIPLALDGEPVLSPHVEPSVDGFGHEIAAPTVTEFGGAVYGFRCWSDGGAQQHSVAAPNGGLNVTALYDVLPTSEVSVVVAANDRNAQYQAATGVLLASLNDPAALCLGRDAVGAYETAFEFWSPVPAGAVVLDAVLELSGTGLGFGQPACVVRAFDVAAAPPFVANASLPLAQHAPLTASSVVWTVPQLASGVLASSPDLAALVQEVVDRPDYVVGSALGIVLDGALNNLAHSWCVQRFGTPNPPRLRLRYAIPAVGGACALPCGFTTLGPGVKPADRLGLVGTGSTALGDLATVLATGLDSAPAATLFVSVFPGQQPLLGGTLLVGFGGYFGAFSLPVFEGSTALPIQVSTNPAFAGISLYFQVVAADPAQQFGVAFSNGLRFTVCP
jgi:glucose/arabinose dehydrogenase/PKD repeat protein